ncbi:MAG TPA: histidine kinase [Lacunisphaera sp.]|nr:histidine kinase [Lacunisphaera sp.]
MNPWSKAKTFALRRFSSKDRKELLLLLGLLLLMCLLLQFGFGQAREWRTEAEHHKLQTFLLSWNSAAWYVWIGAAPVMLWIVREFPLDLKGMAWKNLACIVACSLLLGLAVVNLRSMLSLAGNIWRPAAEDLPTDWRNYLFNTFWLWPMDLLTYCGFFAVTFAIDYFLQHQRRNEDTVQLQLRTARLQTDLTRAELAALRGQLHPHFLFNSFNALATLVRQRRNDEAVEIIAQLSALLRLAIERTGQVEIPLQQELDFIERYLAIEQVRFADKLRVEFAVEPAALQALVPNIVLQPLVENAIKHGISKRTTPGTVRLAAARQEARLHITISNDRADEPPTGGERTVSTGIGLANARAQLEKLYGVDYHLEFMHDPRGTTTVALDLPWRVPPPPQTL